MVEELEVDRLVKEDVIQGVGGGKLEPVGDADGAVNACTGAPALAHGSPAYRVGSLGNFRS